MRDIQLNRFSCLYTQTPDTFRSSSIMIRIGDKSLECYYGGNAQNKDKNLRKIFKAPPGFKLGQIDQSGAEALIVAMECNKDAKFRKLFNMGIKPHTYEAANLFDSIWLKKGFTQIRDILDGKIKDIPKHSQWKDLAKAIKNSDDEPLRYYYLGKKTIHAGNYGEQENTMSISIVEETDGAVQLSPRHCAILLDKHHKTFPEIKKDYQFGIISEASANKGIVRNLFGHPREFTSGIWGDAMFRKMWAFKAQSTVGCITHYAICEIQEDKWKDKIPSDWKLTLLQNGHDSILFCFRDDPTIEREVIQYIRPHIERKLVNKFGEEYNMKSEIATGLNWGPKKESNPFGLEEVK